MWNKDRAIDPLIIPKNSAKEREYAFKNPQPRIKSNPHRKTGIKNKGTINEEIQLTATVTPIFVQNTGVNWSSSNEDLATVNQNGKVILKDLGTVQIIAKSKDDNTIMDTHQIEIVKSELEQLQEEEKYVSVKTKVKEEEN